MLHYSDKPMRNFFEARFQASNPNRDVRHCPTKGMGCHLFPKDLLQLRGVKLLRNQLKIVFTLQLRN